MRRDMTLIRPTIIRVIRGLLVAALLVTGVREAAAQPGSVTGQGSRGEWTVTANVQLGSDGTAAGQLQIVRQAPGAKPTVCRYDAFTKLIIIVNQARFDASGVCRTDTKASSFGQTVSTHVVIIDNSEPGVGADKMEVTPLGQGGVAVPGGTLEAGNFQARSAPAPSLSDLQMADMRRLQAAANGKLEVQFQDGFPRSVLGRIPVEGGDPIERARRFLESYKDLYRLNDPNLALGVRRVSAVEGDPVQTVAFFESYKGLPVFGGEVVALLKGDVLYGTVGALLRTTKIETIPEIGPRQAEDIARLFAGRRAARALGQTELMIFDPSLTGDFAPELHLAWRVTLGGGPVQELFVDAHNGAVLRQVGLEKNDFELLVDSAEHDGNADDTAKGVGRVPRRRPGAAGFPQSARFQQRGGRKFYLNFFLTRDFTGEDSFTLVEHPCTVQDRSGPLEPFLPPPLPTTRR